MSEGSVSDVHRSSVSIEERAMLDHVFMYHPPSEDQRRRHCDIRQAAKEFAIVVLACTSKCADQSAALRHIREAVMTANAAIALEQ